MFDSDDSVVRRAGLLIPLFSIRGEGWGLGEIPDLVRLAHWARGAGHTTLQILPVNEPSRGQNSPYAARTAFALDPAYLAIDRLEDFHAAGGRDALSPEQRVTLDRVREADVVCWDEVRALKQAALWRSFEVFEKQVLGTGGPRADEFREFVRRHADWLEDYALYAALHDAAGGQEWQRWPEPLRQRDPGALVEARRQHERQILCLEYVQWQLERQWGEMRQGLDQAGVMLLGDLPFVVASDSADVWAHQELFRLDVTLGVPPDAFSAEGQDWGLPVYRWDAMVADDYAWMRRRAARAGELFDGYRVDHVVGLYRTYYIPQGGDERGFMPPEPSDQRVQGERLLRQLAFPEGVRPGHSRVIAEDLGTVPDWVRDSLLRLGIPGFRVLRWEKDDDVYRDPAGWPTLSVATTGTHDTDSLIDWYDGLDEAERAALWSLPRLRERGEPPPRCDEGVRQALLELVYASGSALTLVPFQDLAGTRERINVPGTVAESNWAYRMHETLEELELRDLGDKLRALCERTGRAAARGGQPAERPAAEAPPPAV
ncbi:MAG TPA: 4-alpha-glucanotransferase [Polyangia bacterium]|jgi:4-alpha-glucanotransferase|nr:4-alpha-glucanotransferase [Polyangia bacterium]